MSTVVMHNVVSVDGYIADDGDDVGPLFEWYFNGGTELAGGGSFKVSQASAGYVRPMWDSIGSMVIGRHLFDLTNGWEGKPPAGEHVVVVSHRPSPDGWHPEVSYHFAGDVAAAIAKAKALAGERTVAVAAGNVGGQALALGLVDEVAMDVVPVVFGSGTCRWLTSWTRSPAPKPRSPTCGRPRGSPDQPDRGWVDDWLHRSHLNSWAGRR